MDRDTDAVHLHHELEEEKPPHEKHDVAGGSLEKVDDTSSEEDAVDAEIKAAEAEGLRKVPDWPPWRAYLVAIIELCERFTYYGCSGPFQNYISNPYPGKHLPRSNPDFVAGALDRGQAAATGLTDFFQFWCYVTPIIGAIVADQYLGRYNTIVLFGFVYLAGLLILTTTALPSSITGGAGFGGLIASMIIIGLGTGGIKANVSTLIAEQYTKTKPFIKTTRKGERVIVEPYMTVQRIYMIFYICINVGGLSSIATTEMERHLDFWPAYLLCLCMMVVGVAVVILGRKTYVTRPPTGSILPQAFKAMWIGLVNGFNMDAAKPSHQEAHGRKFKTNWTDLFIEELKRALVACRVFIFFPIYWVVYSQMLNNLVSQAGEMALHGIPNDLLQNIDPITIIIFIPIFDSLIYPGLRKIGIRFKPITRIFWGFIFGAFSMAYAAGTQKLINDSSAANPPHVAIQTPAYALIGISEIFASITGLEYAYTKAPSSMKSFIMSMFLLTNAGGSALGIALTPTTTTNQKLLWMYTGLAVSCFIAGLLFWVLYSRYNKTEDAMNSIEDKGQMPTTANAAMRNKNKNAADYGTDEEMGAKF